MKINNLTISYGDKKIFDKFSIDFEKGKLTSILGPSGIGKTTLLRAISGLIEYKGDIEDSGKVSYMFQEARLIPTLTVKENLLFALGERERCAKTLDEVQKMIEKVGLTGEENSFPSELSGGMESRVSLARALLFGGDILLMDEPLRSLDAVTREKLIVEIKKLLDEYPRTVLLVTHDPKESIALSDKIIVLGSNPVKIIKEVSVPKNITDLQKVELEKQLFDAISQAE